MMNNEGEYIVPEVSSEGKKQGGSYWLTSAELYVIKADERVNKLLHATMSPKQMVEELEMVRKSLANALDRIEEHKGS